jgi:general L-amino acid transport system permease protein
MAVTDISTGRGGVSLLNDPRARGLLFQAIMFAALVVFVWWVTDNTAENLKRQNIASGFGFLNGRAGFDISQTPIAYSSDSTYLRALVVGLLNTMIVSAFGIVTAVALGFTIGVGRLSRNWLIRKLSTVYVETFRNIPPLLVIFFWYSGVLAVLPGAKQSLALPFGGFLNNRGFFLPRTIWGEGSWLIAAGLAVGVVFAFLVRRWANDRQMVTGQRFPVLWTSLALIVGFPLLAFVLTGFPLEIEFPKASNFNLSGGFQVLPEFLSLYLALSIYTAAFIAEIVRSGIQGVPKGQSEAARALGFREGANLRLVVIPQAMRTIIPPLTSQFLNLTKNSSLAIAIGYPDLISVGGPILSQTGQSIEIVAIWMFVYLTLSIVTSLFMNWFNARMALVER